MARCVPNAEEKAAMEKRLKKRRKGMYRDQDFGIGSGIAKATSLVDRSQGRSAGGRDFTQQDRVGPTATVSKGAVLPSHLRRQRAAEGGDGGADDELAKLKAKEKGHLQTGGRSYASAADKFNDPNRLTWDEFKKLHGDEMEFRQDQAKDTEKYRKQLDADRDQRLKDAARAKRKRDQEERERLTKLELKGSDSETDESDSDVDLPGTHSRMAAGAGGGSGESSSDDGSSSSGEKTSGGKKKAKKRKRKEKKKAKKEKKKEKKRAKKEKKKAKKQRAKEGYG